MINFPYRLKYVSHKHGGQITEITGIGHGTDKPEDGRSRDYWHFFGTVKWSDGSGESKALEIAPYSLCTDGDEGHAEVSVLLEALNEYLAKHGRWDHPKFDGWYANQRKKGK